MRDTALKTLAAFGLAALLAFACTDSERQLTADEKLILDLTEQLESMAGDGEWVDISVVRNADGSVAYVRAAIRADDHVARKVVLWNDGTEMSHDEALARFDQEHWEKWGRLTRPAVEQAIAHPDSLLPWMIEFDDTLQGVPDRLRAEAADLDPDFEESRHGGGFALVAKATPIIALSRLDGVFFVGSNRPGTMTVGGQPSARETAGGYTQTLYYHNSRYHLFGQHQGKFGETSATVTISYAPNENILVKIGASTIITPTQTDAETTASAVAAAINDISSGVTNVVTASTDPGGIVQLAAISPDRFEVWANGSGLADAVVSGRQPIKVGIFEFNRVTTSLTTHCPIESRHEAFQNITSLGCIAILADMSGRCSCLFGTGSEEEIASKSRA